MLDFRDKTPFLDSILAFDPGLFWKSFAALKKFLFELPAPRLRLDYGLSTNPSK